MSAPAFESWQLIEEKTNFLNPVHEVHYDLNIHLQAVEGVDDSYSILCSAKVSAGPSVQVDGLRSYVKPDV